MRRIAFGDTGHIQPIDQTYPCEAWVIDTPFTVPENATVHGTVLQGAAAFNGRQVLEDEFFVATAGALIQPDGLVAVFVRQGFNGQPIYGGAVGASGRRLAHHDVTMSILSPAQRVGDPELFSMHIPRASKYEATFSERTQFGCVLSGSLNALSSPDSLILKVGDTFCIPAFQSYRLVTGAEPVVLVAYHPVGAQV
jgi:hypothetical protein